MKKISKKTIQIFAVLIATLLIVQVPSAYAANLSDLKEKKNEVDQQKDVLNSEINKKSGEIKTIEGKQDQLLSQITKLGDKITQTNGQINSVVGEINTANAEIAKLQKQIKELQEKIDQRDALLEDRARAIQAGGSISYIDVLLGANSFVDFIDRFSAVNTLMEADRKIMQDQKEDKESLEEQKLVLENTKKKLENKQAELQRLKSSLSSQKAEKNQLVKQLEAEQAKLAKEKTLLEEEYSEYLDISQDLQSEIEAEQQRQLEAARQLERQRQQQQQQQQQSGGSQAVENLPTSSSGFMKPTNGVLTSPYGWRNLGYGPEFHYGVDLANSAGTPIVASADGVVSYAGVLGTYGNVIMITHSINGQIYTTLYAHLSSYNVSVGTTVSQGEKVANMGSTGRSTGPHLHFEVHIGTWRGQTAGVQNPLNYISL